MAKGAAKPDTVFKWTGSWRLKGEKNPAPKHKGKLTVEARDSAQAKERIAAEAARLVFRDTTKCYTDQIKVVDVHLGH